MQLWQLDVTGSVFLADGTECKLISGIDDHSRFCVTAVVVRRAAGRAVCRAIVAAKRIYGVSDEVLGDNGKQFTGRFGKPRPAEVLFERICRRNGSRQRLTWARAVAGCDRNRPGGPSVGEHGHRPAAVLARPRPDRAAGQVLDRHHHRVSERRRVTDQDGAVAAVRG
jgi:Integrase core domain